MSSRFGRSWPWRAVLEGAPVATQHIDVWFETIDDDQIKLAAQDAGGFWVSGFGMQPPAFGGDELARIDVVLTAHGLERFADEYSAGIERVIASKRATSRPKDAASLPALEATLRARQKSG